ncbi:MAG: helix-hairpin-helix domain-containing protein [Chloroflexi bacterium]|nr:helix-hairpin-helix domain-containing protein [Chloroflexota bacterium]
MKPRGQRIDLNTATMAELVRLPRVGESLAAEIVRARPYRSVRALRNVPGVGEKLFHVLRPLLQVGQQTETEAEGHTATPAAVDLGAADRSGRLDVNSATMAELMRLPMMRLALAEQILVARPFQSLPELLTLPGIGEKLYHQLRDYLRVAKAAPAGHTANFDLNTGGPRALLELPGMTADLALAILDGRPFASVPDLRRLPAITSAQYQLLFDYVFVAAPAPIAPVEAVANTPQAALPEIPVMPMWLEAMPAKPANAAVTEATPAAGTETSPAFPDYVSPVAVPAPDPGMQVGSDATDDGELPQFLRAAGDKRALPEWTLRNRLKRAEPVVTTFETDEVPGAEDILAEAQAPTGPRTVRMVNADEPIPEARPMPGTRRRKRGLPVAWAVGATLLLVAAVGAGTAWFLVREPAGAAPMQAAPETVPATAAPATAVAAAPAITSTAVQPPATSAPAATALPLPTATLAPTEIPTATLVPTALPTATPVPTVVPTPIATPQLPFALGASLWTENFDPAAFTWGKGLRTFAESAYVDGALQVKFIEKSAHYWSAGPKYTVSGRNFYYDSDIRVGPCRAKDNYGLVFQSDKNSFFAVTITCEGGYRFLVRVKGDDQLLRAKQSPLVPAGSGTFRVGVLLVGDSYALYVNGNRVDEMVVRDLSIAPLGNFGVYARAVETADLVVAWDNMAATTVLP